MNLKSLKGIESNPYKISARSQLPSCLSRPGYLDDLNSRNRGSQSVSGEILVIISRYDVRFGIINESF